MTTSLVIPLVIWGKEAPTHCISSILMTIDQRHLITGCYDGHLCIWNCDEDLQIQPQLMLFGHSSAVNCLAIATRSMDICYFVSSSDNGEMCLWDLADGRCVENTKKSYIHKNIQAHQLLQSRELSLICNGNYSEILVLHARRLDILFSLCSNIEPDWITATCILRPVKQEDDVVVAITKSGLIKVWTIPASEAKAGIQFYENESKPLQCLNAQMLRCCIYNQRSVLIVCSKYWQVYDASDFSLLYTELSRPGERWVGGDFITIDVVICWCNEGRVYLYKLPNNLNPGNKNFRSTVDSNSSTRFLSFAYDANKNLDCLPAMSYVLKRSEGQKKLFLRGDSNGRICIWRMPDSLGDNITPIDKFSNSTQNLLDLPAIAPYSTTSLSLEWEKLIPPPRGIGDYWNKNSNHEFLEMTSSVYLANPSKLAIGRSDGSILIIPAAQAITILLLENHNYDEIKQKVILGHEGRVTCLAYPHNEHPRYDSSHLVSGGSDFTVVLWDYEKGQKLCRFTTHGGEILQLIVPPDNCNSRTLACICSISSDHSVSLLSLRDRKCILYASQHVFPVQIVRWRPLDDFLVVGCSDGSVYVWQMETGHLDRVLRGSTADDVLLACEDSRYSTDASTDKLANPSISLGQAIRRHNLATFRNLAQQQIKKAQDVLIDQKSVLKAPHPGLATLGQQGQSSASRVMSIHGLRTNSRDPESHVVCFDTEAIIVQLLSEEYMALSPGTLESLGFYTKVDPTENLSDTQKKVIDLISKVKVKADDVSKKIQQKVDPAIIVNSKSDAIPSPIHRNSKTLPPNCVDLKNNTNTPLSPTLIIAQILMSCLHAWDMDSDADKLCLEKLGLLRPKRPLSYGFISASGQMSLLLPAWSPNILNSSASPRRMFLKNGLMNQSSSSCGHWQISSALTTQHLLSMISLTNTLMSMSNSTFSPREQRSFQEINNDPNLMSQNKQGWSILATLHCVTLPELVGISTFQPPQLEMLARRWQDRCLEIREAAQSLLLAELKRIGLEGRQHLVAEWSTFLPNHNEALPPLQPTTNAHNSLTSSPGVQDDEEEEDDVSILGGSDGGGAGSAAATSVHFDGRGKQATAIVMMGVLGAEFGEIMEGKDKSNMDYTRLTAKSLSFLLLQSVSPSVNGRNGSIVGTQLQQPVYSLLRRASVDLIGRGFIVWEPHLDISAILLGLLELCIDADKLVPSMTFGLPLIPRADACRTSRHAISQIAAARPAAFVITMAKEVARFNAMLQNNASAGHQHLLNHSVLARAKVEILRVVQMLVDKFTNDLIGHLAEMADVTVHCLDMNLVKNIGLPAVFPGLCKKFPMISYVHSTRRLCVGTKSGNLLFYDLKQNKCQSLSAHSGQVHAVSFSQDGKVLVSYSITDNKLHFWQVASTSVFNLGSHQIKCIKSFSTPIPITPIPPNTSPLKFSTLNWADPKLVVLNTMNVQETKYRF